MYPELLKPIQGFLGCPTPKAWIEQARKQQNLAVLLIDHANCELKAAQTAMWLIRRYAVDKDSGETLLAWLRPYEDYVYRGQGSGDFSAGSSGLSKKLISQSDFEFGEELIDKMVLLIKEELHHFQQVLEIMTDRGIRYENLSAARYARGLMQQVRSHEPAHLVDKLICGAYIEARSCERFAALAPHVDKVLGDFYASLLRSEARHFEDYLSLARKIAGQDIGHRIQAIGQAEASLVQSPDTEFRFHSGPPA
ncbi:tRNA isopentenyl-2-thiomethyl-A-37 hydroxylase MiaE [Bowmanella dokdonensis]|uniref:tRNA-(Ms[2]io[6]A)-hydroxylase n=1 Tax=Bowmanella dokdonensis TaxID=751969 RepID=A0A939DQ61_9ALTE|nr:tRNA isopentenyl-2-thiomethyl-A-37 hydroxylase MiaE [Bowmanella dokdonensis]MBN7826719.1 tRNA-(ms[2]io[6]A)-hydroxylase [Bowmanella dokdonensis]